jgi:uncharacterized protein YrrD
MKIYSKKRLRKILGYEYDRGFSEAVTSVIKAIESGDKVILGNNTSFVNMKASAPVTMVGNGQYITCSNFSIDRKTATKLEKMGKSVNNLYIAGKL